ncbi:MAG: response regulator transcription factor [Ginsengibacter sp.]
MKQDNEEVINVMIVDDHVLYRAGVKTALSSKKDIKVIAEADNGQHMLHMLKAIQPDVILLDIQMPIMDGITALPEVKKLYPNIKIIMLTLLDDQSVVTKLMELGANSYLVKVSDAEVIYEAIKVCHEQEFYFNALTNKALLNNLRHKNVVNPFGAVADEMRLNDKEITVLRLMCEEKSTREIAEAVDLSPRTIESIRDRLKAKTGSKSTAGLIMYAVKNKLLDQEM